MRQSKTQKMVGIAMLAAVAYLLMFFAFPVVFAFPFMKVDFSEIPILLATYLFGPGAGVMTAFIRSILHFLTRGGDLATLIGNVTSFLAALSYVLPAYFVTRRKQSKNSLIVGLAVGSLVMVSVMSVFNFFVALPLYLKVLNFEIGMSFAKYILIGVVPFNVIKGLIVSTVFLAVHAKLLPWLVKKQKNDPANLGHSAKK